MYVYIYLCIYLFIYTHHNNASFKIALKRAASVAYVFNPDVISLFDSWVFLRNPVEKHKEKPNLHHSELQIIGCHRDESIVCAIVKARPWVH